MLRFSFDLLFFQRFSRQLKLTFFKPFSTLSFTFLFLLGVVVVEKVLANYTGLIASKYIKHLTNYDKPAFIRHTLISLVIVISMALVLALKRYSWMYCYIRSRQRLTERLHQGYMENINFYKLNFLNPFVDNVDQRISQDIDKMFRIFSEFIPDLIIAPFTAAYYTYKCWEITSWVGPLSVIFFFIISTVINKFLMSPVVRLSAKQENLEGEFRYKHVQLRLNSESAAFYRCGSTEKRKLNNKLHNLTAAQQRLNYGQFFLSLSTNSASYFGSILNYIIIAIPIFGGSYDHLDPGELNAKISESSFYTMTLIYIFTSLISLATEVANMAGCSHRVGELLEEIDALRKNGDDNDDDDDQDGKKEVEHKRGYDNDNDVTSTFINVEKSIQPTTPKEAYLLHNVHVVLSQSGLPAKTLVRALSMQLVSGESVIVTGDSGVGKTSLVRTLDSLWPLHRGRIERRVNHGKDGVIFLPQKPYLTNGTLRQQILFPLDETQCSRDDDLIITDLLDFTDLTQILHRAGSLDQDNDWHWEEILSPGEAQRLAFVRLFYHRPSFAVLDEATSQIGEGVQEMVYQRCIQMGITLFSVAHRGSLLRFHQKELRIEKNGEWCLRNINNNESSGDGGGGIRSVGVDGGVGGGERGSYDGGNEGGINNNGVKIHIPNDYIFCDTNNNNNKNNSNNDINNNNNIDSTNSNDGNSPENSSMKGNDDEDDGSRTKLLPGNHSADDEDMNTKL